MSLLNINFDFDPKTNKVTNVTVSPKEGAVPKEAKKARKGDTPTDAIVLEGGVLKLTEAAVMNLKATAGDKINVTVNGNFPGFKLEKAEKGGIALTKANTLNVKKILDKQTESYVGALEGTLNFRGQTGGVILVLPPSERLDDVTLSDEPDEVDTLDEEMESLIEGDLTDNSDDFDFNFDF